MKKAFKSLFAVLLAMAMVFSFAACSDDDDDDGPSAVSTFSYDDTDLVFYSDNSFAQKSEGAQKNNTTS